MTVTVSNNWNIVVGIFLLILAVSGNFVAETISCQSQKLLYNNMLAKNVIILMVIYFSLGFASSESIVNPLKLAGNSVLIWLFFLIFNKMDIQYTIISIVGMFVILVMKDFVDYYVAIKENENMVPILINGMDYIFASVCLTVIVGFLLYFKRQYREYSKSFSFMTFIFGKTICKSLT